MTSESEFLETYTPEAFDRPSLAVDVALITVVDSALGVLLVKRAAHPHRSRWQLPGGFVRLDESLDDAATRVLEEKASVTGVFTEQLYTFGGVDRDPRTRVVSVAYYALVEPGSLPAGAGDDVKVARIEVPWEGEAGGAVKVMSDGRRLEMAFDHEEITGMVVKRLRGKLNYTPLGYELLPGEFTLLDLQHIHETILGKPLNKDSFRRRMLASGELQATGRRQTGVGHRPAALYRHHTSRR